LVTLRNATLAMMLSSPLACSCPHRRGQTPATTMGKVHSERILRRSGFSWGMREEEEIAARVAVGTAAGGFL